MNPGTAQVILAAMDLTYMALSAWGENADAKRVIDPAVASLLELRQKIEADLIDEDRAHDEMFKIIENIKSYRKTGESRL